ncbi:MAG TPA: hypothetical protein VIC87_16900 [Vicinamibacteria bacterium]
MSSLPLLFLVERRQERVALRDVAWSATPRAERLYRTLVGRVEGDLELAVLTYSEAFTVLRLGRVDESGRLLDAAHRIVERCAPFMVHLLATMATFSRIVGRVAPGTRLRPGAFRLRRLIALAALSCLLEVCLVSSAERFRLRVYVLGHAYGLAARILLRESERLARQRSWTAREWARIQSIHGDFVTLKDELLGSLRVLLASL